jgi:2-dehydro-3-deoxyphosphooctonate aldolase (KDO 8-P synthase)
MKNINVRGFDVANNLKFTLIAGPCQVESRDHSMMMAESLKKITQKLDINLIYKSSFDKANRSSISGKRGLGLDKTLPIFEEIQKSFDLPILTDIHNEEQAKIFAEIDYVDILQIPAFLCRQTDLLIAAAKTGKVINAKKGQFLAPHDIGNVAKKISDSGNDNILLTDRGTCFGYNNLVSDMRGLVVMSETGYPVIYDATHSVQQPGGLGNASGGNREFVASLAKAAIAVGVAGIFAEVHEDPDNAPSDGPCMLRLDAFEDFLTTLLQIDKIIKKY